jgi:hypothetical protein
LLFEQAHEILQFDWNYKSLHKNFEKEKKKKGE